MKKIIIIVASILCLFNLFSCKKKEIKKREAMIGVMETLVYEETDSYELIDAKIDELLDFGFKHIRYNMRLCQGENHNCMFKIINGELVLNDVVYTKAKHCFDRLIENNVEILVIPFWYAAMDSNNKFTYSGTKVPEYNIASNNEYEYYLKGLSIIHQKLAEIFPEITYYEMGNELNCDFISINNSHFYPSSYKAKIITDMQYYIREGLKKGNSNAVCGTVGLMSGEYLDADRPNIYFGSILAIRNFLEEMYKCIASGDYPSFKEEKVTNPDDYFDFICWHPYDSSYKTQGFIDRFIASNNECYEIIKKYDGEKDVIWTEFGFIDDVLDGTAGQIIVEIFKRRNEFSYVKAIDIFILTDCDNGFDRYTLSYLNSDKKSFNLSPQGEVIYNYMKGIN